VEPAPEWRGAGGGGVLTDQAELLQEQGVEERDPRASEHRIEMELHTQSFRISSGSLFSAGAMDFGLGVF
jgi:hypothetical protein